jgi:hypothetical protein
LRQQICNLRRRFHKVTITNWRMLNLMCWVIRGQLSHNLQSRLHRSGPHGLINHPPHASLPSCDNRSAIYGGDFTK